MTRPPEAEPHQHVETQLSEFSLPPEAFAGSEFMGLLPSVLATHCERTKTTPAIIERILLHAEEWVRAVRPGEPVSTIAPYGDRRLFGEGGIATGPIHMVPDKSGKYWDINVPMRRLDYSEVPVNSLLRISIDELAREYAHPETPPFLVVGEENVRAQLAIAGQAIDREDVTYEEVVRIAGFLNSIHHTTFPVDYLGLDEPARIRLCNRLVESFSITDDYRQRALGKAVVYAADIQKPEQLAALYDSIEDQWAGWLPLEPGESGDVVLDVAEQFLENHDPVPELLTGVNERAELGRDVEHASFIADLYKRRAEQEHARPTVRPEAHLPEVTENELPAPRDLAIFTAYPASAEVKADIAYIRALRAANYPVTLSIERNEDTMRHGVRQLVEFIQATNDAAARLEAFDAMEFLFNIKTDLQRDELYRLLGERFALSVPLSSRLDFTPHLGVAEVIGQLMPNQPKAENGTLYTGRARTAAMMAHFYRRHAFQLLTKQMRRYRPTEADEED